MQVCARTSILIALALAVLGCGLPTAAHEIPTIQTRFPESAVAEVSEAIVRFETLWSSERSHRDPAYQAELATGMYLNYMGYARSNMREQAEWYVTDAADLESVNLMEYTPVRFKAEACMRTSGRRIRPDGQLLGVFSGIRTCGVYVFVKVEGMWKLLGFLNDMDPRNHEYAPDWLKEIIGEFPQR